MKPGAKLKSAVCDAEVIVIRGGDVTVDCGGVAMAADRPDMRAAINPAFAGGTLLGKRYVDAAGTVELLCTKPGQGTLSIGGVALEVKAAKPLPSSD